MCQYLMVWASLWTLSSMLRSLSSPSPVSPLVDLLPLSLGRGPLSQCQEERQCWMTQWLHSTPTPWLWLGDLEDSTNVQWPTTNPLRLWQAWQSGVSPFFTSNYGLWPNLLGSYTAVELPTDIVVYQSVPNALQVSWTPPSPLGHATGYRIYYDGDDGSSGTLDVIGGSSRNQTLRGLSSSVSYTLSIVTLSFHLPSAVVQYQEPIPISKQKMKICMQLRLLGLCLCTF